MNVLVTGGAGYIGSHTCKALAQAGYQPIAFDSLEHGHRWAVKWGPLVVGYLHDEKALRETIREYQPVAVIHFAAYAYVGESVTEPEKYYVNNVGGSLALLRAMRAEGVNQLIFSSTCAVYGVPDVGAITEATPLAPINPYGASKAMVERILGDCAAAYGLKFIALRYFNAAGADPEGEIGEAHDPEPHLIPRVLDAAMGLQSAVTIYGDDYATADGTCVRDYIHVRDLARAHVAALQAIQKGGANGIYNLGIGSGASVRQVIDTARQVTGQRIDTVMAPRRSGDPASLIASATRANQELGWQPHFKDLAGIIETAWRWHQAYRRVLDRAGR